MVLAMPKHNTDTPPSALDAIIGEIEHLRQAESLLEDVWREIDPYGTGTVSKETRYKMQDFFGFDDSE